MISYAKVPDRNQAFQQLAALGNQLLAGQPFAELAKSSSHGVTAYKGGQFDWTTEGSLRSVVTDKAIHSLPVGQLSQICKTRMAYASFVSSNASRLAERRSKKLNQRSKRNSMKKQKRRAKTSISSPSNSASPFGQFSMGRLIQIL